MKYIQIMLAALSILPVAVESRISLRRTSPISISNLMGLVKCTVLYRNLNIASQKELGNISTFLS